MSFCARRIAVLLVITLAVGGAYAVLFDPSRGGWAAGLVLGFTLGLPGSRPFAADRAVPPADEPPA